MSKPNNFRGQGLGSKRHKQILIHNAKSRAKRRGIHWDLTADDVQIPDVCPVFGTAFAISKGHRSGGSDDSPTLDRIDTTKGYVKDNVQVISKLANNIKNSGTWDQVMKVAAFMYAHSHLKEERIGDKQGTEGD